ncbi:hypothetical protein FOA52_011244 [Chlamydomonas sp. UWO 241]|nr:hypothetical protein FOA52_011244 [Chlamydomonas sp. UWO 241]
MTESGGPSCVPSMCDEVGSLRLKLAAAEAAAAAAEEAAATARSESEALARMLPFTHAGVHTESSGPASTILDRFKAPADQGPLRCTVEELMRAAEEGGHELCCWKFSEITGNSLSEHVEAEVKRGGYPVPTDPDTVAGLSSAWLRRSGMSAMSPTEQRTHIATIAGALTKKSSHPRRAMHGKFRTPVLIPQLFNTNLQAARQGNYRMTVTLTCRYQSRPDEAHGSVGCCVGHVPIVIEQDGRSYWGALFEVWTTPPHLEVQAHVRAVAFELTQLMLQTVVEASTGVILTQNTASKALFGPHSLFDYATGFEGPGLSGSSASLNAELRDLVANPSKAPHNFFAMLFHTRPADLEVVAQTTRTQPLRRRVAITHPTLRAWAHLAPGQEMSHDVDVFQSFDPATLVSVYVICSVDVTATVIAEREVHIANATLVAEKQRTEEMVKRQGELICLLTKVDGGPGGPASEGGANELAHITGHVLSSSSLFTSSALQPDEVELLEQVGQGQYGRVYKARWRGAIVAVKSMTYTYNMVPVTLTAANRSSNTSSVNSGGHKDTGWEEEVGSEYGYEVQLVMEYCDGQTLDVAMSEGGTMGLPEKGYRRLLELLCGVARGVVHLHKRNLVHGDLKTRNVMLRTNTLEDCGFTPKLADFGLEYDGGHAADARHAGTPSHMAPELIVDGRVSKAADVYAFGIMMWEVYTREHAYRDVTAAMLPYHVAHEGLRPVFPPESPIHYATLAGFCWSASPSARPAFPHILEVLEVLLEQELELDAKHAAGNAIAAKLSKLSMDGTQRLGRGVEDSVDTVTSAAGSGPKLFHLVGASTGVGIEGLADTEARDDARLVPVAAAGRAPPTVAVASTGVGIEGLADAKARDDARLVPVAAAGRAPPAVAGTSAGVGLQGLSGDETRGSVPLVPAAVRVRFAPDTVGGASAGGRLEGLPGDATRDSVRLVPDAVRVGGAPDASPGWTTGATTSGSAREEDPFVLSIPVARGANWFLAGGGRRMDEEEATAAAAERIAAAAEDGTSLPVRLATDVVRFLYGGTGRREPADGGVVSASLLNAKPAVGGIGVEPRGGGVLRVLFTVASDAVADTVVRWRHELRRCVDSTAVFDVLSDREEAQHQALWPAFLAAKVAGKRAQFHRARLVVDGERVPAPAC